MLVKGWIRKSLFISWLVINASLAIAEGSNQQAMERVIYHAMARDGFTQVELSYTWLGRLQVVASNHSRQRELVIDPDTGEVLRDFYTLVGFHERNESPISRLRHALGLDLDGLNHAYEGGAVSKDEGREGLSESDEESEGED